MSSIIFAGCVLFIDDVQRKWKCRYFLSGMLIVIGTVAGRGRLMICRSKVVIVILTSGLSPY